MQYQINRKLQKGGKFNLEKLRRELVSKNNSKQQSMNSKLDMVKAKSNNQNLITVPKSKESTKETINREEFTYYTITSHFIQRAQERFGIRNFDDEAKNYNATATWLKNLLNNYDEITEDRYDNTFIRCKSIVLVYKKKSNVFTTCYTISYDIVNKNNDSLNTTITKKKLNLDSSTKAKVEETLRSLYYRELRSYSKDLADYYGKVSEMYKAIAGNKHNNGVDNRLENIKEYKSIINSVELKVQAYYDVAFGDTECENND